MTKLNKYGGQSAPMPHHRSTYTLGTPFLSRTCTITLRKRVVLYRGNHRRISLRRHNPWSCITLLICLCKHHYANDCSAPCSLIMPTVYVLPTFLVADTSTSSQCLNHLRTLATLHDKRRRILSRKALLQWYRSGGQHRAMSYHDHGDEATPREEPLHQCRQKRCVVCFRFTLAYAYAICMRCAR